MGVAAEYKWTDDRTIRASVAYIGIGDAPVETAEIPGLGSLKGEYVSRDTWQLQIGMGFDALFRTVGEQVRCRLDNSKLPEGEKRMDCDDIQIEPEQ